MRVDAVSRVDADLLARLGVTSPAYQLSELDRFHVAEHRRGSTVSYLVARDDQGDPVGLLPTYLAAPPWSQTVDPAKIFDPPATVGTTRLCLAGSAGAYANSLEVAPGLAGDAAARVATALVEQALAIARRAGSGLVLLPYLDAAQAGWLRDYGAVAAATNTRDTAMLPVTWDSFEDYLSWLPTHRRSRVRNERRVFARCGIEVREVALVEVAGALAPLLTQTQRRHGIEVTREAMEFFLLMLGTQLEGDTLTLVGYRDERPVGFTLAQRCADRWIMRAWGCDYASLGREGLYFNLAFYEPIIRAIGRGVPLLDFGVAALEAKKLRGCRLEPLWTVLVPATATV